MWRVAGFFLLAVCVAGVAWYVAPPKKPRGFSGLEFAVMTPAAAARAPLLTTRGALVFDVMDDSPADKAGIKPGEVAAAIDGAAISSARQASDIMRGHRSGDRVTLTLFDETLGDLHPREVTLVMADAPPVTKKLSVRPPRTLAREYFYPPTMAANASWSRKLSHGPSIRPRQMTGLGDGQCNGFAMNEWEVRGHAKDNTMFHIAAKAGFQHAIYANADLGGQGPVAFIAGFLEQNFQAKPVITPSQADLAEGFQLVDFGTSRGVTGFVEYRITGNRITLWVAAVPSADASWDRALVGAIVFSLHCKSQYAPPSQPAPPSLIKTSVSLDCLEGRCQDSDLAAAYLKTLQLGYVHNLAGDVFLINPRRDFWQNGAEGPGFYRQVGGDNEKLEPGRIN